MSTWLRMLVIAGITAAGCVNIADDADDGVEESGRNEPASSASSDKRDAGMPATDSGADVTRTLVDASAASWPSGRRGTIPDAEPDAEADSDLDAGFPELAEPILRDCTETLRCDLSPRASLESCVAQSTRSLAGATPEARQRFVDIVMRCRSFSGCDYISCVQQP